MADLSIQFNYDTYDAGGRKPLHRIRAVTNGGSTELGSMLWDSREIRNIGVLAQAQRRGVATAMWNEGHRLASETKRVPAPKHSADRTDAGTAWAKSVGGRLPRK